MFNPFEHVLAAAVCGGIDRIGFGPGSTVLYLGAGNGRLVEHLSNIVGLVRSSCCTCRSIQISSSEQAGHVYAVERDVQFSAALSRLSMERPNVTVILEDPNEPEGCVHPSTPHYRLGPHSARTAPHTRQVLRSGAASGLHLRAACLSAPGHRDRSQRRALSTRPGRLRQRDAGASRYPTRYYAYTSIPCTRAVGERSDPSRRR